MAMLAGAYSVAVQELPYAVSDSLLADSFTHLDHSWHDIDFGAPCRELFFQGIDEIEEEAERVEAAKVSSSMTQITTDA